MSSSKIDSLANLFYVPQFRRFEHLMARVGIQGKYSGLNLTKARVSWALRSGAVEFDLAPGRTLRSGKVNNGQDDLLKKLKVLFPDVTELKAVLDQVLKELPTYEKISDGVAKVGPWNGTWFSDTVIPNQLKEELDASATKLEKSIPNSQKDWHYGGESLVLNLVHPSIYSVNVETTRILKKGYRPEITNTKDDYSKLLQHKVTGDVKFVSRKKVRKLVNPNGNTEDEIHGKHHLPPPPRRILVNDENNRIRFSAEHFLDKDYQWLASDVFVDEEGIARFGSYINNLFDPQVAQNVESVLSKMIPLFERTLTDLRKDSRKKSKNGVAKTASVVKFNGRKIQVIVTMSNIILTPQTPKYPGGRLHVDGMDNEKIVAVGIYYYSCKNISESRLALSDKKLKGNSFETVSLGSIETKEGRCFVFPNNIQHQVLPFELADPTVPGHRKRLTFFLVDPSDFILSSAHVPPQQKYWWIEQLKEIFDGRLPPEIVEHIGSFCISRNYPELKSAREHRDKLAKRRTAQVPSRFLQPLLPVRQVMRCD